MSWIEEGGPSNRGVGLALVLSMRLTTSRWCARVCWIVEGGPKRKSLLVELVQHSEDERDRVWDSANVWPGD